MCSDAPDYSGMNRAAEQTAALSKDALDWYKQVYNEEAPMRQQAIDRANQVSDAQLNAMNTQTALAKDYADYNKRVYRPLEERIVSDAENYDSQDRQDQAAGKSIADVQLAAAGARAAGARELERVGVNPSDGAYGSMERSADINTALGSVDAANKSRMQVQNMGRAMRADAANMGRGLPSAQAAAVGTALSAGNSSVGNAQVPLAVAGQGAQMVGQGFNTAIAGQQASGNLYGQVANMQERSQGDMLSGLAGLGMAAGRMGLTFSSKKFKKNRKQIDTRDAVDAIEKMPVQSYQYKEGAPGDDGGKTHVGPMAEDVRAAAGDQAAPGGKVIDNGSLQGITLAAVQQLSKDVRQLNAKVNQLAGTEASEPEQAPASLSLAQARRQPAEV
jgi:hypothetical protein